MKIWQVFWAKSSRYPIIFLLAAAFIVGIIFWGGFNTFMEYTNRLEFCVSCHEMEQAVYQEYKKSPHYSNASGVRAVCSDCHVPKEWFPKLVRKIKASQEVYHKLIGSIDTVEKFEGKRLELAKHVWATMEANDSHECRNCHSFDAMNFEKQHPKASKTMQKAMKDGATCIDCHKGIAHKLPDMSGGYKKMYKELIQQSKDEGAKADHLTAFAVKSIYLDTDAAKKKSAAGRLMAPTSVDVVDRDGDFLKVRIHGWQQDQVDRVIYEMEGQRIFTAVLKKSAIDKIERTETIVDKDTELTWHKVNLDVWVDKADLIEDVEPMWAYSQELYTASCSVCHSKPDPAHSLANQWIGTLKAMSRFVSLDKAQLRFLQKYLQLNAKDTGGKHGHE
ncbi:MAG: pentaheme c-type cytochrome TorC [Methylocystaceae bacterium]|nr:pentaheme c-type cytochrome TorC [Methylocystaceae bacterium]